ncbi:MAG: DNA polymerase III subunit gamma/tau [Chloroflexota bacterium]|nr:DNA polymerase III subunit gamma/tau [Chloroflexota bacterium]
MAQALYRKWRAQSFSELAGQEAITRTLKNAIASNRTTHAYLFCGPRGTGKTSTGRILAKALNCLDPREGEPCNACRMCQAVNEGRLIDLIEIDAASNRGIDEIRDLREKVRFAPTEARRKVYIIDEVHMLTEQAFNALLKTLEEPPEHVVFILATTEVHKVPLTIVSRCQRFDFRRIPAEAALAKLRTIAAAEGIAIDDAALALIVRASSGSLRDAENLLDQAVSYYGSRVTVEDLAALLGVGSDERAQAVVRAALDRDLVGGLRVLHEAATEGVDLRQFARQVIEVLRRVVLLQVGAGDLIDATDPEREALRALAERAEPDRVVSITKRFSELDLRSESVPTLALELALYDACVGAVQLVAPSERVQGGWPPQPSAAAAATAAPPAAKSAPPSAARRPHDLPANDLPYHPSGPLLDRWRELYARLKAREPIAAPVLVTARPVEVSEERVVVTVRDGMKSHVERRRKSLETALAALYGHPVQLIVQTSRENAAAASPEDEPTPPTDLEQLVRSPTVQHAMKTYGATIAGVEHDA